MELRGSSQIGGHGGLGKTRDNVILSRVYERLKNSVFGGSHACPKGHQRRRLGAGSTFMVVAVGSSFGYPCFGAGRARVSTATFC